MLDFLLPKFRTSSSTEPNNALKSIEVMSIKELTDYLNVTHRFGGNKPKTNNLIGDIAEQILACMRKNQYPSYEDAARLSALSDQIITGRKDLSAYTITKLQNVKKSAEISVRLTEMKTSGLSSRPSNSP